MRARCTCGTVFQVSSTDQATSVACPQCGKKWKLSKHKKSSAIGTRSRTTPNVPHQSPLRATAPVSAEPDFVPASDPTGHREQKPKGDLRTDTPSRMVHHDSTDGTWTATLGLLKGLSAVDTEFVLSPGQMTVRSPDGEWTMSRREAVINTKARPAFRSLTLTPPDGGKMRFFASLSAAGCWDIAGVFAWLQGDDPANNIKNVKSLAMKAALGAAEILLVLQLIVTGTFATVIVALAAGSLVSGHFLAITLALGLPVALLALALTVSIAQIPWGALLAAILTIEQVCESLYVAIVGAEKGVLLFVVLGLLRLVFMTLFAGVYLRSYLAARSVKQAEHPAPQSRGKRRLTQGALEAAVGLAALMLVLGAWLLGERTRTEADMAAQREGVLPQTRQSDLGEQVGGRQALYADDASRAFPAFDEFEEEMGGVSMMPSEPPVLLRGGHAIPYCMTLADVHCEGTRLSVAAIRLHPPNSSGADSGFDFELRPLRGERLELRLTTPITADVAGRKVALASFDATLYRLYTDTEQQDSRALWVDQGYEVLDPRGTVVYSSGENNSLGEVRSVIPAFAESASSPSPSAGQSPSFSDPSGDMPLSSPSADDDMTDAYFGIDTPLLGSGARSDSGDQERHLDARQLRDLISGPPATVIMGNRSRQHHLTATVLAYRIAAPTGSAIEGELASIWEYHDTAFTTARGGTEVVPLAESSGLGFDELDYDASSYSEAEPVEDVLAGLILLPGIGAREGFGGAFAPGGARGAEYGYSSLDRGLFGFGSDDNSHNEDTSQTDWPLADLDELRFDFDLVSDEAGTSIGNASPISNTIRVSVSVRPRSGARVTNAYLASPPVSMSGEADRRLDWEVESSSDQRDRFRITLLGLDDRQQIVELPLITGYVQCPPLGKGPFNPRAIDWSKVQGRTREVRLKEWAEALAQSSSEHLVQLIKFHERDDR